MSEEPERHGVTRIRRERRRRELAVESVEMLSPSMKRIRFTGEDLADFESASPDDHIKIFVMGANGERAMRDYTPRAYDNAARSLTVDFAIHEAGPVTKWAVDAQPGEPLSIGGPQGSSVLTDDFDWYLLVGDETALPSIGRRAEELRAGVPVMVVAIVNGEQDRFDLAEREGLSINWVLRSQGGSDAELLKAALDALSLPEGEGYAWIAAEASVARDVRNHVIDGLGHPKAWTKAAGYWIKGTTGSDKRLED